MTSSKKKQKTDHDDELVEFESKLSLSDISKQFLDSQSSISCSNWALLLTDKEIQSCVRHVAAEINRIFAGQKIVLTAILKGAFMFLSDLTKNLTIPYSVYFLEASSYGDKQVQSEEVQLLSRLVPSKFRGNKVVLIDELFDHGKTMHSIRRHLLNSTELSLKEEDIFCCTLFSKDSGTSAKQPDLVGISKLPNVWLVGYGLDDQGEKRGWPHLYVCPKIEGIPKVAADEVTSDNKITAEKALIEARKPLLEQIKQYK